MFDETLALTNRALKKWVRNPATILPGLFTAAFYLALFEEWPYTGEASQTLA